MAFIFPFHIWDVILPIDELIFFRGVETTNQHIYIYIEYMSTAYIRGHDYSNIYIYITINHPEVDKLPGIFERNKHLNGMMLKNQYSICFRMIITMYVLQYVTYVYIYILFSWSCSFGLWWSTMIFLRATKELQFFSSSNLPKTILRGCLGLRSPSSTEIRRNMSPTFGTQSERRSIRP